MKSLPPLFVPTAILVILYTVGLVGLAGPWTEDLVYLTPYNLLITAGLLLWQARPDARTWAFALLVFVSSYLVETLGVHTGVIFGTYWYGDVLGAKLFDTPLLIGVNWLILVMSVGPLVARPPPPRPPPPPPPPPRGGGGGARPPPPRRGPPGRPPPPPPPPPPRRPRPATPVRRPPPGGGGGARPPPPPPPAPPPPPPRLSPPLFPPRPGGREGASRSCSAHSSASSRGSSW
ncbi:MAG: carotenoid biosynthesis protein [Flavobacteriales bacterium]|nr:carotenoid biosynthesis protein [Flavobacteriales bacterium]